MDLLLEERLDAIVEIRAMSISEKLANFEPFASNADDNQKLKSYTSVAELAKGVDAAAAIVSEISNSDPEVLARGRCR